MITCYMCFAQSELMLISTKLLTVICNDYTLSKSTISLLRSLFVVFKYTYTLFSSSTYRYVYSIICESINLLTFCSLESPSKLTLIHFPTLWAYYDMIISIINCYSFYKYQILKSTDVHKSKAYTKDVQGMTIELSLNSR